MPQMTLVVIFAIYGSRPGSLSNIISPFLLLWNTKIHFENTTNLVGAISPIWDHFGARFAVGTVGSVTAINACALMPIVLAVSALSYFCV